VIGKMKRSKKKIDLSNQLAKKQFKTFAKGEVVVGLNRIKNIDKVKNTVE
jgi:hypothetical protein